MNVADIKQEPISPPMAYHPPPRGGGGGAREGPALDSRECRSGDIIVTDGQTGGRTTVEKRSAVKEIICIEI